MVGDGILPSRRGDISLCRYHAATQPGSGKAKGFTKSMLIPSAVCRGRLLRDACNARKGVGRVSDSA